VRQGAAGNGGNITISSGSLSLTDGAFISASTFGTGNAGNIKVDAKSGLVTIAGVKDRNRSAIFSQVGLGAVGKGGNIEISSGSFSLTDRAVIDASTFGKGDAGNIKVDANSGLVTIAGVQDENSSGIFSQVGLGAVGKGGNIEISSGSFSLTDGARISASTSGIGDAGEIVITTTGSLSLSDSAQMVTDTVRTGGNSGNIKIKAQDLSMTNNAALVADVSADTEVEKRQGANIDLDVKGKISLVGGKAVGTGESTRITLGVQPGRIGSGGNLKIQAGSLEIKDGAIIKNSTQGKGNAGNIEIHAGVVDISGSVPSSGLPSGLFTSTGTNFQAGNITIDAPIFKIADGAALSARSTGSGKGGDVTVKGSRFEASNGGQLLATASGEGSPGNISVEATQGVVISGSDRNYLNRIQKFPEPINTLVANDIKQGSESGFFVSSESSKGTGNITGNITVNSPQIRLGDRGKLFADSQSGKGGDIILNVNDLLLLRNQSLISATAGSDGNGGNISINAPSGFLVGVRSENSDIIANASRGSGGNVDIKAAGIYFLAPLSRQELTRLRPDRDPRQLATNDITAISRENPNLSGQINIDISNIDPKQGLATLPARVVDTSQLIASGCGSLNGTQGNEFTVTGRGGLPPNPDEPLGGDAVWTDTRLTSMGAGDKPTASVSPPSQPKAQQILPATGWVFNGKDEVTLVSANTAYPSHSSASTCHAK
jgi:large exoprotein involved in heme utilization and adhesion